MPVSKKKKRKKKRSGSRSRQPPTVRLSQAEVSAVWRATSAGDFKAAVFVVRDLKPELSPLEAQRVATRIGRGANSPGVSVVSDPKLGECADVSLAP